MNRIKEIRRKCGITQIELCKTLEISQSSLSMWETGKFEPDLKSIFKMCEIFGCSSDYMLGRVDKEIVPPPPGREPEKPVLDNLYMHLAREAQDMRLPEEDVDMILDFARRMKEKNDRINNR